MKPAAELVFDFSSSAKGGSLPRINAYVDYFSGHPIRTHFLISDDLKNKQEIASKVSASIIQKNGLSKLTIGSDHLFSLGTSPKWCFSYGIPVKTRFAEKHWLHLSNVLPFTYKQCTLSWQLRLKSMWQFQQYKYCASNVDLLSGESNFTVTSACIALGWAGRTALLRNGVTPFPVAHPQKERYALAVGTETYKRIDLTYEVFSAIRQQLGLTSLVIVGNPASVPEFVRNAPDVICETGLSHEALMSRYRRANYFISTSEVENSSLAVLEGLSLTRNAILSDIPSHREMLQTTPDTLRVGGKSYLRCDATAPNVAVLPSWDVEIGRMLHLMQLD